LAEGLSYWRLKVYLNGNRENQKRPAKRRTNVIEKMEVRGTKANYKHRGAIPRRTIESYIKVDANARGA